MLSGTVPPVSFGDYLKGLPDQLLLREAIGLHQGEIPDPKRLIGISESHLRETLTVDEPTFRRVLAFRVLYDRMANHAPSRDKSLKTKEDLVSLSKSTLPGWHVVTADRNGSVLSLSKISPPGSVPVRDFVRETLRSALLQKEAEKVAVVAKTDVSVPGLSVEIDELIMDKALELGLAYLGSCETSLDGSLLRFGTTLFSDQKASPWEMEPQDAEPEEDQSDDLGGPR